ncbi:uncharacterized protein LOC134798835 [Cydia splendana]|uniref:uncharacterized protein LOC134798835 n=1 Tax=Cydia splendana TaxID=1100963 RepID=UPI002139C572
MDSRDLKGFLKFKKPRDELVAGELDNTAPVKKIVDDLVYINRQAFGFIHSSRFPRYYDERTHKHFLNPGHLLAAFPDDWDGDLSLEFYQPFRYKCMRPKMIATIGNNNDKDPIAEFLKLKQNWYNALVCQKKSAHLCKIPLVAHLKEHSDDIISCPKHLVDMAIHWDNDPDPYFNSTYNWYYAGNGNMQLLVIDSKDYLMCSEINVCYLFEFNRDEVTFSRDAAAVFDCGEGNNICESICSSQNIIALRTKYKIFVLKIVTTDDNELEIELLKVSESKTAYTGISFDECHKNILYVTDLNNTLKIVNLDRLKARTVELKNSVKSLVNNWSTVISNERAYYTHVSTRAITLYDKRTNGSVRRWSNPDRVADDAICALISAAKYSLSGPYLYVATNHNLLLMDMRYQKNLALKPLQRWTHGMQSFPSYISICNFERDKELICLSSQWCEDTCVVPNYLQREWTDPEFKGMTIPYRLPSIIETLNETNQQSLLTDLYKSVENRLVTALSGSLLLEDGEKYVVLSQNSLGDVTSHVMYPDHMSPPEDDAPKALHDWSQYYVDEKKDFIVTFYRNISPIWKLLEKIPEGEFNKKFEHEKTNFSEQEVLDAFEKEEIEESLLDVWVNKGEDETRIDDGDDKSESSLSLGIMKDDD